MCILIYVHKFCWTWGERLTFTKTGLQLYDCMSGLSQAMNLGMFHDFYSSGFVWCDDGFVSILQLEMCLNFQLINILVGAASKVWVFWDVNFRGIKELLWEGAHVFWRPDVLDSFSWLEITLTCEVMVSPTTFLLKRPIFRGYVAGRVVTTVVVFAAVATGILKGNVFIPINILTSFSIVDPKSYQTMVERYPPWN